MSFVGRIGVWTWLDAMPAAQAAAFAKRVEAWGYSALWLPEAVGRDPFAPIALPRRPHDTPQLRHRHREHLRARRDDDERAARSPSAR